MTAAPSLPRAPLLTAAEVGARLGIEAGDVLACIPAYWIERQARYDATEIEAWGQTPTGRSLLYILRNKPPGTPWWRCGQCKPDEPEPIL
jgi:hypothetical protein